MPGLARENWHEDRTLLDAFRRGERAALSQIYYAYVDDVTTLLRGGFTLKEQGLHVPGVSGRDGECELVQEVFFRAFQASARAAYDGLRPYGAYLLRIARNLLIDRQRKQRRQPSQPLDDETLDSDSPLSPTREEDLHWHRLSAATSEYLATLDDESRGLVRLRFEEELSQEEVASQLGISRRRVRTLEEHVQAGLRRFLKRRALWGEAVSPATGSAFGLSTQHADAGSLPK